MEKTYNPKDIEQKWYQVWEQNNYFAPSGDPTIPPYCIMIPPPNVTGVLHMGHAFQDSLIDALVRYHRMRGYNTLWQVGTDHAGIATQMVVERQLAQQNVSRLELGRDKFVEKVWQWKQESGGNITRQLRRLGASVDWQQERFTLDDGLSKAVQKVFIQLYQEGLIYRGQKLVNWDPALGTAVSDLEVVAEEEQGQLWYINYPLVEDNSTDCSTTKFITVATTRPETMLGDVAIAVNPTDERYQYLIGKYVHLPLTERKIPIIADSYVESTFGTGCVKITPAHDFNDYEVGERHDLAKINILTPDAKINGNAPTRYQGLDRFAAREKVIADLQAQGLLVKTQQHTLKVPRGDRSKAIIEPYLTNQWFVKTAPLAEPAIAAVKQGKIKFIPQNWDKTYFEWMNNIQDWCISRQLWWGHRIPAWYDAAGNIYVAESEAGVRSFYKLNDDIELTQDNDVLDTWFSSALWPFSTLGWPEATSNLKTFYPTSVLVTGFDIIFFWVARMIMFGLKFTGQIPFDTVYIHGLIQDQHGQKMSKSKGNILDPIDIIDGIDLEALIVKRTTGLMQPQMAKAIEANTKKQFPQGIPSFGTDALRFAFYSLATANRHIKFDLARVEGYRNFCNKLWNASRYVLMQTQDLAQAQAKTQVHNIHANNEDKSLTIADRWILSRWQQVKINVIDHMDKYRFDLVATDIYEFVWNEYCDWYLELSKPVLYSASTSASADANTNDGANVSHNANANTNRNFTSAELSGTRHTLLTVLEEILRVTHPLMPFITEEIWQLVAPLVYGKQTAQNTSIMSSMFPLPEQNLMDQAAEDTIAWLKAFVLGIRNIRGEMNIAPSKPLPVLLVNANTQDKIWINEHEVFLKSLAKIEYIKFLTANDAKPAAATALVNGELQILIPLANAIDPTAEIARLERSIAKLSAELEKAKQKLNNPGYIAKAPAAVVEKEKLNAEELEKSLAKLNDTLIVLLQFPT